MKRIFIVGFRGTGFRSESYKDESLLIRAGHVGFYFEGEEDVIFGFHPTEESCLAIGDDEAVKEWLKAHRPLDGTIFDDTAIFERASELADSDAPTDVWQVSLFVNDEVFQRIRMRTLQWYNDKITFTYAFPQRDQPPPSDCDNCATFPRRLEIPLPELTGQLARYIDAIQ